MVKKWFIVVVFCFMLTSMIVSQDFANCNLEIRSYYFEDDHREIHEVFLVTYEKPDRKHLILCLPVSIGTMSSNRQWLITGDYHYCVNHVNGRLLMLKVRPKGGFTADEDLKKIEMNYDNESDSDESVAVSMLNVDIPQWNWTFGPVTAIESKEAYQRELSLQSKRMNGDDVWILQRFLVEQGYKETGDIDGWFGPNTEKAVKRFQRDHGLHPDGIVGKETWESLSGQHYNAWRYTD